MAASGGTRLRRYPRNLDEHAPGNAQAIEDRIFAAIEGLVQFPRLGRYLDLPEKRDLIGTRTPYVVVRQIDDDIVILRLLHGSQRRPG